MVILIASTQVVKGCKLRTQKDNVMQVLRLWGMQYLSGLIYSWVNERISNFIIYYNIIDMLLLYKCWWCMAAADNVCLDSRLRWNWYLNKPKRLVVLILPTW